MIEIGRLCVKIAGRDSRRKCVIVDVIDNNFVLVDGDVRRRKCNIDHLELLDEVIEIAKKASHEDIISAFKKLKFPVWSTKPKDKTVKPQKQRKVKVKKPVSKKKTSKIKETKK